LIKNKYKDQQDQNIAKYATVVLANLITIAYGLEIVWVRIIIITF